jgi:RNA polymerase sigma factor (sigma-70 family)
MSDEALDLIRQARSGQTAAVRILVERLMPVVQARVQRRVMRMPGSKIGHYDRDDLVQEIWLALVKDELRVLSAYDPARGATLEGYVGMIAEREIGNIRQRELEAEKRKTNQLSVVVEQIDQVARSFDSPEANLEGRRMSEQLGVYLEQNLPPKGRIICRYVYGDHAPIEKISEILGVSRQVVYNWQHKIRQLAQEFFERQRTAT